MWIYTTDGQLSIVCHHQKPGTLLVRSRSKATLERWVKVVDGDGNKRISIFEIPGSDYQWRCEIASIDMKRMMCGMVDACDYSNFKSAASQQSREPVEYVEHLHEVWQSLEMAYSHDRYEIAGKCDFGDGEKAK